MSSQPYHTETAQLPCFASYRWLSNSDARTLSPRTHRSGAKTNV